jgi:hypothetical protein
LPQPLCDCPINGTPLIEDNAEECSPDYQHDNTTGFTCAAYTGSDCIPVWFIQNAIDVYAASCPTLDPGSQIKKICDHYNYVPGADADGIAETLASLNVSSFCCLLDCWRRFIDRKGTDTCISFESLQTAGWFATSPPYLDAECYRAWLWILLLWQSVGLEFHAAFCFGHPFPLLPGQVNVGGNPAYAFGINGPVVSLQVEQVQAEYLGSDCIDIELGEACECPTV